MSGHLPSSVMRDLVDCETKEDLSRLISLLHATLDSECESCITKTKIDSTIVVLLETDAILASLFTKFDRTIAQFTWKRLISFIKLYHALISSELIVKVTEALNCRAYQFIDALCALSRRENYQTKDQFPDYASVVSCMQPLIFFSQRISALLAYFPSYLSDASYQKSMDVIFFLRGFLSTLESCPSHLQENMPFDKSDLICRSEEYFWKALHPPLSALPKEMEGETLSARNGQKRSRSDLGEANKSISAERSSYGHLTQLEKFYLCARSSSSTSSSGHINIDPRQRGSFFGCILSIGICLLASYEIEKLSDQIKTRSSATNMDNAELEILLTSPDSESQLQGNPLKFILRIFLFTADKVLILYNSVCSDKYFTGALRRFKESILNYLESIYMSVHPPRGKAAAVSDALLSSLITKACEGAKNNFATSRVARNLLCGIVSCMSNSSQTKVGEILYGMYTKISSASFENDDILGDDAVESNYSQKVGNADSSVEKIVGVRMRHGSHVGHLRAIALTIRYYLSTMKLTTVHSFLSKIKELSDLDTYSHHSVQSADVDRHVVRKFSGNMELLLHSIPFTLLLKRCRNENISSGSLPVTGQRGLPQGTLLDLLSGLLVGSLSQVNQRETERDITHTKLKDSDAISQGAVLGVTVLSNMYSNRDDNFMTSNSAKDITLAMQAAITHKSPMMSLAALKSSLLKSISAISKYFRGLSANSSKGSSIRTSAQYRKVNGCLNALLRLTKAVGAILEMAPGQSTEGCTKEQQQQQRDRHNRTLVELTASDMNILTSCASATQSVSNIITSSWTSCHDTLCISSILKSVKCVCKIILVNVNFAPKEIFDASRSFFPSMITTALSLSRAYQMAVDPSQELHCVTAMHLHTGMKIASLWSLILSCLVTFAKRLPPSLQSSVPSLVPQKALILVQAASRGSSGSILRIIDERNTPTTSGPLVTLTDAQKTAVSNALLKEFCSNLKQYAIIDDCNDKLKLQKTGGGGHDVGLHGSPRMHMGQTSLSIRFLHNGAGENASASQRDGIRMLPAILLGFPSTPLDSSFSASFLSPSLLGSNIIPVIQALLVGENDKIEITPEVNTDIEAGHSVDNPASILPVRGSCSYALLVLPAVSSSVLGNNILFKSTDSFAVLNLTEQTSKI